jgi:pyruvate dehydrogenase E2 component (dihydrolipoamide acetyltransferase)
MPAEFETLSDASSFARIAAAMWRRPSDPSIYGSMDVDATEALRFIQRYRERTGRKLTITHVVARAVAQGFAAHPRLNAKVRLWGRLERRRSVDLFVSVAAEGGKDLSGVLVEGAERKSLDELIDAIERGARGVRSGADPSYQKSRGLFQRLPWWLARPMLSVADLLTNELHLHLPSQGLPRDPFGTAIITNVGTFGIDTAFAPFLPLGRCALLLLLSEIRERPWAENGRVESRPVLRLCGTFDHRVIDGYAAGKLARAIRDGIEHPDAASAAPSPVREAR